MLNQTGMRPAQRGRAAPGMETSMKLFVARTAFAYAFFTALLMIALGLLMLLSAQAAHAEPNCSIQFDDVRDRATTHAANIGAKLSIWDGETAQKLIIVLNTASVGGFSGDKVLVLDHSDEDKVTLVFFQGACLSDGNAVSYTHVNWGKVILLTLGAPT